MNDMRKLMNLMESVERLDEAAPGLSAIGLPKDMIRTVMSKVRLDHDAEPLKMDTRPTVAYAREHVVFRKTRGGDWYVLYPLSGTGRGRGFGVIRSDGDTKLGDTFGEVKPHFGKGASEYWSVVMPYYSTQRGTKRHGEVDSEDPLESRGAITSYMNRVFLPGLRKKAGPVLDRIFDNMRHLHRGYGRSEFMGTSFHDSEREVAVDLAANLEELLENGFDRKVFEDFLRNNGKLSSGFASIPANADEFQRLIQQPLGRQKFAQTILQKIKYIDRKFQKLLKQSEQNRQEQEAE